MKPVVAEMEQIYLTAESGLVAEYLNDKGGIWHFHPEFEIMLNLKVNGTRIIGDNVELFDEYDMVLIAGNIPHCWNYYKTGGLLPENHGISIHFPANLLGNDLLKRHEIAKVRELFTLAERGISFSVQDAKSAEKHLTAMINHTGIDKIIDFFQVLRIMCSSVHRRQLCTENYRIGINEQENERIAAVFSFVRENYHKDVSLKDAGKITGMKPLSFSKYFSKNTGTCFVEYVNQVRINRACYLLRETTSAFKDIAKACGFTTYSNFNKQFRKTLGMSPRTYRIQHTG